MRFFIPPIGWPLIRAFPHIAVAALLAALSFGASARAITIRIDYSTDTGGFFPVGSQARATIDAVAAFYSNILDDTFSEIKTPGKYQGSLGGEVTWNWTQRYTHPTTGAPAAVLNPTIPANEFTIFVGAANLSTLGIGGPGGYTLPPPISNGNFTAQEITEIEAIHNNFLDAVTMRHEDSGFARWGGFFAVDSSLSSGLTWHLDHTTLPPNSMKVDLYSVAVHEIGHALGIGNISSGSDPPSAWQTQLNGPKTHFIGEEAVNVFGGPVPLNAARDHWASGTASKTFNGLVNQEASLDPEITNGTRKHLTLLDAAALVDIGWEIDLPTPPAVLAGDYNNDGKVNAADYTVWRNNLNDSTEADINFAGNGGNVSNADYTWWKARYGNTSPGTGGLAGLGVRVPEPSAGVLMLIGVVLVPNRRLRRDTDRR